MDLRHIRFEGTHTNRVSLGSRALARHPSLAGRRSPTRDEPVAGGLPAHILAQHGLDPARYRHRPLERRIGACLRALRVGSEVAAWERVEDDRAAQAIALNTLLIGVSSFFRDAAVFEVIPNDGRRCLDATRQTATRVERGLLNGRGVVQRRDDPRAGRAARRR
jgi:hypothetical protein